MHKPDQTDDYCRDKWSADQCVRDATVTLEFFHWPSEAPEHIYIGGFSRQNCSHSGVGRLAVQARPADAGPG